MKQGPKGFGERGKQFAMPDLSTIASVQREQRKPLNADIKDSLERLEALMQEIENGSDTVSSGPGSHAQKITDLKWQIGQTVQNRGKQK